MKSKKAKIALCALLDLALVLCAVLFIVLYEFLEIKGIAFIVTAVLMAAIGALQYLIVKKISTVVLLNMAVLASIGAVGIFIIGFSAGSFYPGVLAAFVFALPLLLLLCLVPSLLSLVGAAVAMLICRPILKYSFSKKEEDIRESVEVSESEVATEDVVDIENIVNIVNKDERPAVKSGKELVIALLPVFVVFFVCMLGVMLWDDNLALLSAPVLAVFYGMWAKKRSGRVILPTALYSLLFTAGVLIPQIMRYVKYGESYKGLDDDALAYAFKVIFGFLVFSTLCFAFGCVVKDILKKVKHLPTQKVKPIFVYPAFALLIIIFFTYIFIYDVKMAYDDYTGAGFLPRSWGMLVYAVHTSLGFAALALVLKIVFSKCRLSILLLCALIIPYVQYAVNMYAFQGPLASTVEKGGVFYFIVNRDFNFDGYNDEWYRKEHTVREFEDDDPAKDFEVTARMRGKGAALESSGIWAVDESAFSRKFHFRGGRSATIYELEMNIVFKEEGLAQKVKIYRIDRGRNELVKTELVGGDTLRIVLDEAACTAIRNDPLPESERFYEKDCFYVNYKIVISD